MAYVGLGGDPLPVAATGLQQRADLGVEIGAHAPIIAKLCASRKQHFAHPGGDAAKMAQTTINRIVASVSCPGWARWRECRKNLH